MEAAFSARVSTYKRRREETIEASRIITGEKGSESDRRIGEHGGWSGGEETRESSEREESAPRNPRKSRRRRRSPGSGSVLLPGNFALLVSRGIRLQIEGLFVG